MYLTSEQLKSLLDDQKRLCEEKYQKSWNDSGIFNYICQVDKNERVIHRIQGVISAGANADYPTEYKNLIENHE